MRCRVLFCLSYKHNSPLVTRKPTLLMNENKRIRNRTVPWRQGSRWKHDNKNSNGHNFQFQNSHLLTLSLPTEEVF